jgi:hypothetical protein
MTSDTILKNCPGYHYPIEPIAWIARGPVTISTFEPEPESSSEILMFSSVVRPECFVSYTAILEPPICSTIPNVTLNRWGLKDHSRIFKCRLFHVSLSQGKIGRKKEGKALSGSALSLSVVFAQS